MNYETVERCGRIYVVKNGVESACFAVPGAGDCWLIYRPIRHGFASSSLEGALTVIALGMDTWYTVAEAAIRLVELGKVCKPPSTATMYRWLRAGKFPGAIKVGAVGRGGSWRLPGAALREFKRKGDEKMRLINAYTIRPDEIQVGDVMLFVIKAIVVRPGIYRLYRCPFEGSEENIPQGSHILNEREVCQALFPTLAMMAEPD